MEENQQAEYEIKDKIIIKLTNAIKYSLSGEFEESDFVEIRCPSYKDKSETKYLRNLSSSLATVVMDSKDMFKDESEKIEAEDDDTGKNIIPSGAIMMMLMTSMGDDFSNAVDHFSSHAGRFCFIGGEVSLTKTLAEKVYPPDMDKIFCSFIANFLMPSLIKSMSGSD